MELNSSQGVVYWLPAIPDQWYVKYNFTACLPKKTKLQNYIVQNILICTYLDLTDYVFITKVTLAYKMDKTNKSLH